MCPGCRVCARTDGAQATRIWLAAEPTDMRCGFDSASRTLEGGDQPGPAVMWRPFVVFRSRHGELLNILTRDRDGYVLWNKLAGQRLTRFGH
jgi:transposase